MNPRQQPLKRYTELRAKTELRRTVPLSGGCAPLRRPELPKRSKKKQRQDAERTKVLRPLREAQTWCSLCGQTGVGLDAHEVRSRARGGSVTDLDNIRLVCRPCHSWITEHPREAQEQGWAA